MLCLGMRVNMKYGKQIVKNKLYLVYLCVLGLGPNLVVASTERCSSRNQEPNSQFRGEISKVSDGDTLEVRTANGIRRIRLLHMDTPETHFQGKSQGEAGEAASERLAELLPLGAKISVAVEENPCDIYGRFLGRIILDGDDINLQMVEEGYAASLCFAPNLEVCLKDFVPASKKVFAEKRTVFQKYGVDLPHEFRFRVSGRPEATLVGDFGSKNVVPFARHREIQPLDRIFFLNPEAVKPPFRME
jgi:endonuclease YncB( thermonuclease family)